jgi:hypothetical protein
MEWLPNATSIVISTIADSLVDRLVLADVPYGPVGESRGLR